MALYVAYLLILVCSPPCSLPLSYVHSRAMFFPLAFLWQLWKTITFPGGLAKFPIWPITQSWQPHHRKLRTGSISFVRPQTHITTQWNKRGQGGWGKGSSVIILGPRLRCKMDKFTAILYIMYIERACIWMMHLFVFLSRRRLRWSKQPGDS